MSQFTETLELLYSQFLLRDILAKAVPGFLALLALSSIAPHSASPRFLWHSPIPDLILLVVLYGVSFMFGMLLQYVGKLLHLLQFHVWKPSPPKSREEASLAKLQDFLSLPDSRVRLVRQRERFVILKEMSATYGLVALFALTLIILRIITGSLSVGLTSGGLALVAGLLALLLLSQSRYHSHEQQLWESLALPSFESAETPKAPARPGTARKTKPRARARR